MKYENHMVMKKALRETQTLRAKIFRRAADPLAWGAGLPEFNQLATVNTCTYRLSFGEDRCTQFRVIVVTDSTRPSSSRPSATDRTDYNTLRRYA